MSHIVGSTGPYAEEPAPRRDVHFEVVSGRVGSNPAVGAALYKRKAASTRLAAYRDATSTWANARGNCAKRGTIPIWLGPRRANLGPSSVTRPTATPSSRPTGRATRSSSAEVCRAAPSLLPRRGSARSPSRRWIRRTQTSRTPRGGPPPSTCAACGKG